MIIEFLPTARGFTWYLDKETYRHSSRPLSVDHRLPARSDLEQLHPKVQNTLDQWGQKIILS
jgi:hypothetical protein